MGDLRRCDVIVIGAGPAGAAVAAKLAAAGVDVIVAAGTRLAGTALEVWSPRLLSALQNVGADQAFLEAARGPIQEIRSSWGASSQTRSMLLEPWGLGWLVERPTIDAALQGTAADHGASMIHGVVDVGIDRAERTARLRLARGTLQIEFRYVVDATGRRSRVARQLGARRLRFDRLVCVLGRFRSRIEEPVLTLAAAEWGWLYALGDGDGLIAACLTDSDLLPPKAELSGWFTQQLHRCPTIRHMLGNRLPDTHAVVAAHTSMLDPIAGPGWLAVGDAAFAVDPLAGDGAARALEGAVVAARALIDELSDDGPGLTMYAASAASALLGYLGARRAYYGAVRRWPDARFWRRRQPALDLDAPVTLDPTARTVVPPGRVEKLEGVLALSHHSLFEELACEPCPAHEIVRDFQMQTDNVYPAELVIRALQVVGVRSPD